MRSVLFVPIVMVAVATGASAQEPPIQSPQDAACRDEARGQVFTAPNPNRLSLWDLGSQIYHACMSRAHSLGPNPDRQGTRF